MMSKGCPITETKRIVFRFHETILSFGEPGSLGYSKLRYQDGKWTDGNRPMVYLYLIYHRNQSNIPGRFHFNIPVLGSLGIDG